MKKITIALLVILFMLIGCSKDTVKKDTLSQKIMDFGTFKVIVPAELPDFMKWAGKTAIVYPGEEFFGVMGYRGENPEDTTEFIWLYIAVERKKVRDGYDVKSYLIALKHGFTDKDGKEKNSISYIDKEYWTTGVWSGTLYKVDDIPDLKILSDMKEKQLSELGKNLGEKKF